MHFVLDAGGILHGSSINIKSRSVLERLSDHNILISPELVRTEAVKWLPNPRYSPDENTIQRQMNKLVTIIPTSEYSHCLPPIKEWYQDVFGSTELFDRLDDGEKHCVALALFINRSRKSPVCTVTDDFKALRTGKLEQMLREQQVGWIFSTFEASLYASRASSEVTREDITAASKDYFQKVPLSDRRRSELEIKMVRLCRCIGNQMCSMPCAVKTSRWRRFTKCLKQL